VPCGKSLRDPRFLQQAAGSWQLGCRTTQGSQLPPPRGAPPCAAVWPVRQYLPVVVSRCGRPIRFPARCGIRGSPMAARRRRH